MRNRLSRCCMRVVQHITSFFSHLNLFNKGLALLVICLLVLPAHKIKSLWTLKKQADDFEAYTTNVPGSEISFTMLPIEGGEFMMGSPESEPNRNEDEGPQVKVKIDPFWMASTETTWDMFEIFAFQEQEKRLAMESGGLEAANIPSVDAVSRPTPPYLDMSFGMGKYGYPAICMTQYSAQMFCKWLTAKTGVFYRLPTEAEWEYACRAGTTTAYSFGDDEAQLDEYAWHYGNTNGGYEKVGTKKPNPWGLYDMHGNISEWTLDQYDPDFYASLEDGVQVPYNPPTTLYPRTVRGGSYDDDPEVLRSAARIPSNPQWKQQDPQIPKSNWWHTDARFVGFRIIRPLNPPSEEQIKAFWPEPIEDL
jgi:formylglycine-generating enzyme required for sulfatase activity